MNKKNKNIFLPIAALSGFFAVALGAFGAHILKDFLDPGSLQIFETGVRYQMYHTLALLAVAIFYHFNSISHLKKAGWLFVTGILLFSGSLYILSFSGVKWIGAITPLGGLAYLGGWLYLLLSGIKNHQK